MEVLAITSTRLYVFAELLPIINLFDRNTIKPEIYSHIIAKYLSQEQKNNHGGENFYKGIEIQFKRKVNMDPTKPILDLYGDSAPYENTQRAYRQPRPQPSSNSRYSRPPPQKEISYTDLKQKYQELYQAYSQKVELASSYEQQLESYRSENDRLKDQLRRVEDKNEQMNATLLNKNVELEEAYRQLQEDIRRGQKSKKNDEALDRLEEGLREAIVSNFNLLREAALSQLKQY